MNVSYKRKRSSFGYEKRDKDTRGVWFISGDDEGMFPSSLLGLLFSSVATAAKEGERQPEPLFN
jgi:hypothetical protein